MLEDKLRDDTSAEDEGGYDALIGFSQGCLVILSVLFGETAAASAVRKINGVVLAGCPAPLRHPTTGSPLNRDDLDSLSSRYPASAALPSLLVVGTKDEITPAQASRDLASALFQSSADDTRSNLQVVEHPHAHSIPQSTDMCEAIENFLETLWKAKVGIEAAVSWEDTTRAAILEEVDVLAATFGDDLITVLENAHDCKTLGGVGRCLVAVRVVLELSDEGLAATESGGRNASATVLLAIPADYPRTPPDVRFDRLPVALDDKRRWQVETLTSIARDATSSFSGGPMLMMLLLTVKDRIEEGLRTTLRLHTAQTAPTPPPTNPWEMLDEQEDLSARASAISSAQAYCFHVLHGEELAMNNDPEDASLFGPPLHDFTDAEQLPPSSGGSWHLTVGLIGKPSAGKSTFFNAATNPDDVSKTAKVAAFPFTTIEPNIGFGLAPVRCPCHVVVVDGRHGCDAEYGHVSLRTPHSTKESLHCRCIPISVKDVAGLVQGAYQGRGKGNQFLNDLCDADVLVHVVDGSASTDAEGAACQPGEGSAADDVEWVRNEIHSWIFDNLRSKWTQIARRPDRLYGMFTGYRAPRHLVDRVMRLCGVRNQKEAALQIPFWRPREVHQLVALFVALRFPIVTALNKQDVGSAFHRVAKLLRQLST